MDVRRIAMSVGFAVVAVLLQAVLSSAMTIGPAVPNFILAYVIGRSIARPDSGMVAPFILGLIYDLMGNGPLGAMALVCLAAAFAGSRLVMLLNNDTLFIPIVLIVVEAFLANVLYGILVIACGMDAGIGEALLGRALPCGLYDMVLALLMFVAVFAAGRLAADPLQMR